MESEKLSRRQALALGISAGTVAWAVPEILTASIAQGATLSTPVGGTLPGGLTAAPEGPPEGPHIPLAFTGLNLEQNAVVGGVFILGGWAMHHWAARLKPPAPEPPARPDV